MIRIRVPATSANLGPGFDSLGLALSLYNYFEVEDSETFSISGCPPELGGPENLFLRAARRGFEELGRPLHGLRVKFETEIPIARGLGSSAACIVGGLLAASALAGSKGEGALPVQRLLDLAAELEGHPDNTSPALLGGFAVSAMGSGKATVIRAQLGKDLAFSALVPPFPLETSLARAALPKTLPFADAAFNLARSALVTAAMLSRDWDKLELACRDRLHEPYRAGLIPGFSSMAEAARGAGALAVYLSGAGPTVMAISRSGEGKFFEAMDEACSRMKPRPWSQLCLAADDAGAGVVPKVLRSQV